MNFFEKEMRQMFGDTDVISEPKFVGKTMLGKLDDELRVKLQFISTHISKHYDAIQMSIINRTDGVIDKQTMLFGDIIGQKTLHGTPNVNPYMWEDNNKGMWYSPVSLSEKAQIADAVLDYVGMYQEQSMSANEMQFA